MANSILQECTAASQNDLKHASAVLFLHASELADDDIAVMMDLLSPFTPAYLELIPIIDRSKKQLRSKKVFAFTDENVVDEVEKPISKPSPIQDSIKENKTESKPEVSKVVKSTDSVPQSTVKTEAVISYEGLEEIIRVNLDLTPNIFSEVLMRRVWTTLENGYEEVQVVPWYSISKLSLFSHFFLCYVSYTVGRQ